MGRGRGGWGSQYYTRSTPRLSSAAADAAASKPQWFSCYVLLLAMLRLLLLRKLSDCRVVTVCRLRSAQTAAAVRHHCERAPASSCENSIFSVGYLHADCSSLLSGLTFKQFIGNVNTIFSVGYILVGLCSRHIVYCRVPHSKNSLDVNNSHRIHHLLECVWDNYDYYKHLQNIKLNVTIFIFFWLLWQLILCI